MVDILGKKKNMNNIIKVVYVCMMKQNTSIAPFFATKYLSSTIEAAEFIHTHWVEKYK